MKGKTVLNFLKSLVNVQTLDLEAKLFPAPSCAWGGKGEVELEAFHNGNARMEVEIKHSGIPDGTSVELVSNGSVIATVTPIGGFIKERYEFSELEPHPEFAEGDLVEMRIGGQVCY
ncbi:MAG: hypothetical protein ACR2NP_18900, partial [Pirellulaceae bacterium]